MSDNKAPSAQESTSDVLGAFTQYLPGLMQAYRSEVLPTEQANLDASKSISPQYQQLMSDLFKQFGPQLAETGSNIDTQTRKASAATDADILNTSGRDLAKTYKEIDTELNPEYYKTRADAGGKLAELLGSINLDDASPEAERLVNQENIRSGNISTPSATNTVGNALSFGKEKSDRRSQLGNAINVASSFLTPSSNAQFNPATAALNRPTSNTGISQFGGVTKAGDQAYTAGSGFLNNISGFQDNATQVNANRRDILDRLNETTGSLP